MQGKIINLHISCLPYNRGSAPNFFSFYENTPKGVTIHQMSAGLDTGDILLQKEIELNPEEETFVTAYDKLLAEIKILLKENWEALRAGIIKPAKQSGEGTYHTVKDYRQIVDGSDFSWDMNISDAISKLKGKNA